VSFQRNAMQVLGLSSNYRVIVACHPRRARRIVLALFRVRGVSSWGGECLGNVFYWLVCIIAWAIIASVFVCCAPGGLGGVIYSYSP
jgi:hypothetical protein